MIYISVGGLFIIMFVLWAMRSSGEGASLKRQQKEMDEWRDNQNRVTGSLNIGAITQERAEEYRDELGDAPH